MPKGVSRKGGRGKGKAPRKKLSGSVPLAVGTEEEPLSLGTMTLQTFSLWTAAALKVFLSVRKKSTDGTHTELAARAFIAWEEQVAVDLSEEHSLRANLAEYTAKLTVGGTILPDPFTLADGWLLEEGRVSWPSVYVTDIADFLKLHTTNDLYHRLLNEYKQGKAYRYFTSGWVKEINYHPISPESPVGIFAAKVIPSMRLSAGAHQAWIAVQKDTTQQAGGKIYSAYCTCTAGLKGTCNHTAGILFRVEYAVRSGLTKPSCTSAQCVWNVPGASGVSEPIVLSQQVWKKDQYFSQGSDDYHKSVQHLSQHFAPMSTSQSAHLTQSDKIRADMATILKDCAPTCSFLQLYEGKPFPKEKAVSLPPPPLLLAQQLGHPATVQDLEIAMQLTSEDREAVHTATITQGDSADWVQQRQGRITASNFHRVNSRMKTIIKKPDTVPNALVGTLMGYTKVPQTTAIKHGKAMEGHAKREYRMLQRRKHRKFHTEECGLSIEEDNPMLAASPDLRVTCSCEKCGGSGLCEIKCPESIKDQIPTSSNWPHLEENYGITRLSRKSPYYTQVQGQMGITKLHYCDFFVYTAHGYHLERIEFDSSFWEEVKENLIRFWREFIAPEVINGILYQSTVSPEVEAMTDHTYAGSSTQQVPSTSQRIHRTTKGPLTKSSLPPVYLCGVCGGQVVDTPTSEAEESVECSACQLWYHKQCIKCGDISLLSGDTEWYCFACKDY